MKKSNCAEFWLDKNQGNSVKAINKSSFLTLSILDNLKMQ